MPTIEETAIEPSLTPPSTAMWECASMIPGISAPPAASRTTARRGILTSVPTATILPSFTTTVPFSIVSPETVHTVALVTAKSPIFSTGPW